MDGLGIVHAGGQTRLKWHRLRREATDPEFGLDVLRDGFALGASMEIDLQVRGDHGFVVMHDAELDRETTGRGPVREASRETIDSLRYRQSGGPLVTGEALSTMLGNAHPDALLQFDMKNEMDQIGAAGVAHLAEHFSSMAQRIIVSGGSLALINALGDAIPGLRRGIDPTDRLVETWQAHGLMAMEQQLNDEITAAQVPEMVYLSWELILAAAEEGLDLIDSCHSVGCAVDAWTFNPADPQSGFSAAEWQQLEALVALKPDQITTDHSLLLESAWVTRQSRV